MPRHPRSGRTAESPRTLRTGPPRVPGYRITSPLGFGVHGPVWAATAGNGRPELAGAAVAIAVLPPAVGERAAARVRRLDALVAGKPPHCAAILDVVPLEAGRTAVVSERVDGPTLAALRASRAPLSVGEVAQVVRVLGLALADLHARGVVHGDVSPANVVVRDDGALVLVDLTGEAGFESGTAGFRPPERPGAPAGAPGDVWAAATLALWLAGPHDREALTAALAPALVADPAGRCDAEQLAGLAEGLSPRTPVGLPTASELAGGAVRAGAALEETRLAESRRPRRRPAGRRAAATRRPGWLSAPRRIGPANDGRRSRAVPAAAIGWFVVAAVTGAGLAAALPGFAAMDAVRGAAAGPAPSSGSTAETEGTAETGGTADRPGGDGVAEPLDVVAAAVGDLLARRDAALAAGDAGALAAVSVPGSPAAAADRVLLDSLAGSGLEVDGLVTSLEHLDVRAVTEESADVAVVTSQSAYTRSGEGGGAVVVPAQPRACVLLGLALLDGRWLVRETGSCPAGVPTGVPAGPDGGDT